jgi:manganese/zinc/iron transport system permease protein
MFREFFERLSHWVILDTWIAVTGALAAMACTLPGTWLLLRRQSLLGDALSHAVLPGIVIAYMGITWLEDAGWLASPSSGIVARTESESESESGVDARPGTKPPRNVGVGRVAEGMSLIARRQFALFLGAALSGVVAAMLSEVIQRWGRVERSAALGVVFTSMFALGLLLIPLFADRAHLDTDCVLYGNLEATSPNAEIPHAVVVNAAMLLFNGLLVVIFFKELKLNTFDPELGASQGLRPNVVSLVLMSVTAATVVAAFESVGAILVIAMLIVPAATARLLTDRLAAMLGLGLLIAAVGAVLGHAFAITLPAMICSRIGFPRVDDASTAGMMSVTAFGLFLLALFASPRHGVARAWLDRLRLQLRIAREDLLSSLYRREEAFAAAVSTGNSAGDAVGTADGVGARIPPPDEAGRSGRFRWLVRWSLFRQRLIQSGPAGDILTESGELAARNLVRSHRLWELYMARHFELPADHLHATAEQVEHFLGPELQAELAAELDQPTTDPHGKSIPQPGE